MAGLVPAIGRGTLPLFWHSAATDGRHKAGHDGEARFIEGGSADGRWELAMTGVLVDSLYGSKYPARTAVPIRLTISLPAVMQVIWFMSSPGVISTTSMPTTRPLRTRPWIKRRA